MLACVSLPLLAQHTAETPIIATAPLRIGDYEMRGVNGLQGLPSGGLILYGFGRRSVVLVSSEDQLVRSIRTENDDVPDVGLLSDSRFWLVGTKASHGRVATESSDSVDAFVVPTELRDEEGLPLAIGGVVLSGVRVVGAPDPTRRLIRVSLIGRQVTVPSEWPTRPDHASAAYLVTDPVGRVQRFLAYEPGDSACRVRFQLVPFCARPQFAVAPRGDRIVVASSDAPHGDSVRVRLVLHSAADTMAREAVFDVQRVPLSTRTADSARIERLRNGPPSGRPGYAEEVARLPIPDFYPPVSHVRIATDGMIWLVIRRDASQLEALVLDASLRVVTRRLLPPATTLMAAFAEGAVVRRIVPTGDGPIFRVRW